MRNGITTEGVEKMTGREYQLKIYKPGLTVEAIKIDPSVIYIGNGDFIEYVYGRSLQVHFNSESNYLYLYYSDLDGHQDKTLIQPSEFTVWDTYNNQFDVIASVHDYRGRVLQYLIGYKFLQTKKEYSQCQAIAQH